MFGHSAFGDAPFSTQPDPRAIARISVSSIVFLKNAAAQATISVRARANWDFRLLVATAEIVADSKTGDPDEVRPYLGTLKQALRFERSFAGSDSFDSFTTGFGSLAIDNTDGSYDYLVREYAIDGRPVSVRLGRHGDLFATYGLIFSGTAKGWHIDEDVVRIDLRDEGYRLEVPAQPNTYKGTGGVEGTSDLKGKRKPRAFGEVAFVAPPLVIPNLLAFQVNDGPIEDIPAVYSRGGGVTRGPDYATLEDLLDATIPSGTYSTCLAAGWFRINFKLEGEITADVKGDRTGGYVDTVAGIVRRLVTSSAKIANPDGLYLPAFQAVAAAQPAVIGYWLGIEDEVTVADVTARIMASVGGWVGHRRLGKLEIGIFASPSGIPAQRFTAIEITDIQREQMPEGLNPPPYRYRVGHSRVWSRQSDLAGSVSDERRAYLAEEMRLAEAVSSQVRADHPLASDPAPIEAFFRDESAAQAEAERRLALFGRTNSLYRIDLAASPYLIEIGSVVHITYRRWDLAEGRLLRVVSTSEDSDAGTIQIVGFG